MVDRISNRITPEETALFTSYLIHDYELQKGKSLTRCRLSRGSVRLLGIRSTLREAFTDEWAEALASDWGWIAFPRGEEFVLVRDETMDDWLRLGTKRVADLRKRLKRGDRSALDEMRQALSGNGSDEEEDDEEL